MPDKIKKIRGNDPRLTGPKIRGDCRRLELSSGTWQWAVRNSYTGIAIYDPSEKRHLIGYPEFLGMTAQEWSNYLNRDWDDFSIPVTPLDIKTYIERNLI